MMVIWTPQGSFSLDQYVDEKDLETSIRAVRFDLFGSNRIYLDIKKKVGIKGGQRNIPDGYLIDLSGNNPKLYVVENELAYHDPLRHIATQLLEFSLSVKSDPRSVKAILLEALEIQPMAKEQCEKYAALHNFRNLDHLIEDLVHADFAALVIVDEIPDKLQNILAKSFAFVVEPLALARYKNARGEYLYHFRPFLSDIGVNSIADLTLPQGSRVSLELEEYDTIIVPSLEDGFHDTFLRENRWWAVRISGVMRPLIKYVAVYRVAPISAITHYAPVSSIELWEDTDKFVINFSEPAHELAKTVQKGTQVKYLRNIQYTNLERLLKADTLDDI